MSEQNESVSKSDLVVVHSDAYANWVFDPTHPTQGRRFINGLEAIKEKVSDFRMLNPRHATWEELSLVHSERYIAQVLKEYACDEWVGKRPDLADLAQQFVGGTLVALEELLSGRAKVAVHLPGAKHHAQRDKSSGFCVFADFAIAAKIAVARGYKVAIFDYDAHHGDGTENLCADDPNILTYSVHEAGLFPGTGNSSDPSRNVYNRPLDVEKLNAGFDESDRFNYRHISALIDAAGDFGRLSAEFGADIIFFAAGADGHIKDRLSHLQYHEGLLIKVFGSIFQYANLRKLPVLIGGAGGYCPDDATPAMWAEAVKCVASETGCWI